MAAIVAGWGVAQSPTFLPGLTVEEAAAERSTLVALLAGSGSARSILAPSLFVLFRLVLTGRFDAARSREPLVVRRPKAPEGSRPLSLAMPLALGVGAAVLLVVATVFWLQLVAALAMLGAIGLALPRLVGQKQPGEEA